MRLSLGRVARVLAPSLAALVALLSILALGGYYSSTLDILNNFAPVYFATALLLLFGALASRSCRSGWVWTPSVVALAINASIMAPEFVRDAGPTAPPGQPGQIKVIQFNALRSNTDIEPIVDWLVSEHPDVVTITEARNDLRARILARTGWHVSGGHSDLLIFTPHSWLAEERPWYPPTAVSFVNSTFGSPSGPFEVLTTHVLWPTDARHELRLRRLQHIVALRPRGRMVFTGDFNATPWSFQFRRFERALGLVRRDRALATYPASIQGVAWPLPFLAIDHVFAGPGWATVSLRRGPSFGSDHYSIVAVFAPTS